MAKTLSEIAERCGAVLQGDGSRLVVGPADLGGAGPDQVSFLANPRYAPLLESTQAAAVLVPEGLECAREGLALLRVADPNRAFSAGQKRLSSLQYTAPMTPATMIQRMRTSA